MAVEITRTGLSASDLRREATQAKDARASRRMLALALVLEGKTPELLWLPPVMQEASDPIGVRSSAHFFQAYIMHHFQKPLDSMVICGSGPNLRAELFALSSTMVFPIRICSINAPIQVVDFSHPPGTDVGCLPHVDHAASSAGSR